MLLSKLDYKLVGYSHTSTLFLVLYVGWGTTLQPGRSRVRFPMVSLKLVKGKCKAIQLQAWTGREASIFQDNRHMKMVRLSTERTGSLYPQQLFLLLISVIGWVNLRSIVRPEGLFQLKIPMTPSGIEHATFLLVAQCFNQLRHRVPKHRNEYQEYFLGVKGGRCVGLTTLSPSCADCLEIWEPQPPGTIRACPCL